MPEKKDLIVKFNDEKLKEDIVKWVNDSKRHYYRRIAEVDEYVKRYEAKRSISGLMGWGDDPRANPKNFPWDNACYSPDTEVLTKRGWIFVKDVTTTDLVYSMNPMTKEAWWMPVIKTQISYFSEMVHFQGKSIDLMVSPNHNMLVVNKNWLSNVLYPHSDSLPAKFIRADNLLNKKHQHYSIPLISEFVHFEKTKEFYGFKAEDWLEFLGWYISEGYTHKNSGTIGIAQSEKANKEKCNEIKTLLARMNLKYSFDGKQFFVWVSKVTKEFNIIPNEARKELKDLGLCYEKYIPQKYLDLEPRLLNILLNSLIKGDGNIRKRKDRKDYKTYYTTSKRLADNIQEIAQKIGLRASFYIRNCVGQGGTIRGRSIIGKHKGYAIGINTKNTIQLAKLKIGKTQYNNLAYCCTTPFHTLYVRRNGKAVWCGNSDIGIPIEAFTIEGLLPRFLKVCYGAKPIVWVRGQSEDDLEQASTVQEALNFQVSKVMKIYRRMKVCFKNVTMSGDAIIKCVWEESYKTINRTVYYAVDGMTGEPLVHQPVEGQEPTGLEGQPIEFKKDEEIPPVNPLTGGPLFKSKQILSEEKKVYDSPKLYSRNIKQIVIPKDADTPEIEELDWVADQYERTLDWLKRRIGDIEDGQFEEKAVKEIEQDLLNAPADPTNTNHNFKKILITEWHGKYDVNNDGLDEEIVVFVASKDLTANIDNTMAVQNSKMLGWMITPYPRRPFFHYQIIPMDGSFYGKGVPEFLIGIRNLIDALFNQAIDRGSIANNPPIITPTTHDPDENPFGPAAHWATENPGAYKILELPKSEQMEFVKIEFLLSLVAKLFGVTDFVPPPAVAQSQRTATGIMTIVGEGNIKFDDMIRALQDVNEDLYDFIVLLDAEFLEDELVYRLTGKDNPFDKIGKQGFVGNFDFEAAGNSININRQIEQSRADAAYSTSMNSFGKNPVITDEVMLTVTDNYFKAIDMRNVKLPTLQELQQRRIQDLAQAMQLIQQQEAEALAKQGGKPGGQAVGR